jgi:transcriptional regulator with XRE-family HTH domain
MENFRIWLEDQLRQRGWKQADLIRLTGLDPSTVSNILNGKRRVGPEACKSIARALGLPPEQVYRVAGLLPPKPGPDEIVDRAEHIIRSYKREETKQQALEYLEYLAVQEERAKYGAAERKTKPADSGAG